MRFIWSLILLLPLVCAKSFPIAVNILSRLPRFIQNRVYKVADIDKEIDFTVQPNSIWVGYRIYNDTQVVKRLPPGLTLAAIKVFPDSEPENYVFFNFFSVNSTYLQGHRLEIVTVAYDSYTNQKRFVILDYFSDTISSDPEHLFKRSNAKKMVLLHVNNGLCAYIDDKYFFLGECSREGRRLSTEFAVGCNHNIFYGSKTAHLPNHLTFNEEEVSNVRLFSNFNVILNTTWSESLHFKPDVSFYYPYKITFKIKTNKLWDEKESF